MFIALLRLVRWKNLLMIAFTMYVMRYCLVYSMLRISHFELQIPPLDFFLLCFSVLCIAAAGYIINDYFDVRIDQVNKSGEVIVGKTIARNTAMNLHLALNVTGIGLGYYLGYQSGLTKLGFIHLVTAGLLWYYSSDFKRQFLVGNIVVAVLSGIVPVLPGLYEMPLLYKKYKTILDEAGANFNFIAYILIAYAGFAFLLTLAREIVKDMEDYEGDEEFGRDTLPIKLGQGTTRWIASALLVFMMGSLGYIQQKQFVSNDKASFYYFLFALQLPILYALVRIFFAREKKDFTFISAFLKVIMLLGICYSFLFSYLLLRS